MGLFEPEGIDLASMVELTCAGRDAGLHLFVDPRFLAPPHVRDGCILFNVEGYGRFRLYVTVSP